MHFLERLQERAGRKPGGSVSTCRSMKNRSPTRVFAHCFTCTKNLNGGGKLNQALAKEELPLSGLISPDWVRVRGIFPAPVFPPMLPT